jgi:hypothetical protein
MDKVEKPSNSEEEYCLRGSSVGITDGTCL